MKARRMLVLVVVMALRGATVSALAQGPAGQARPATPVKKTPIATVGPRIVYREELDRRAAAATAQFNQRNGNREMPADMRDLLRRQVLEGMIRLELLALEARRTGVTASPLDAENVLKQDPFFNPNGQFDESRFMAVRTTQPQAFNAAVASLQEQLAARKLNDQLEARFRGDESTLRNQASHDLTRLTLDHLSLRRADFPGAAPEPREADIVAYWRAHRSDFARPDRAELTIAFVNRPALTDSVKRLPGGEAAWSRRMKAVADSVLDGILKGQDFATATAPLGAPASIAVTSDNFPGYWRGTAAQNAAVFEPRNLGHALATTVPAVEGWLIVRVDAVVPAHVAAIREVAREIRAQLRRDARAHRDENDQRALYATVRDSLAAPGWRFRYAFAATDAQHVPEPGSAELDRFYRGHLADYSSFDATTSSIQAKPFESVRADVRERLISEQRALLARTAAERLYAAWSAGRSDAGLEAQLGAREAPAATRGSQIDTSLAARALSDSLWAGSEPAPAGLLTTRRGWIVWKTLGHVDHVVPSFEQARPTLDALLQPRRDAADEAGARKLFDSNPAAFRTGNEIHVERFAVTPPRPIDVKLTHAEVEKWHHDHIDKYSAPELVRARHILISPKNATPVADAEALARARQLLARARAGENFEKLAKDNSDDPATRDKGGDLGTFGRGVMLDAFEKAVFALEPGQLAPQPVKTEVGYHVILCLEHVAAVVQPLPWVYTLVGTDAATAKGELLAQIRADSILGVSRTPAALRATAARMGYSVIPFEHRLGDPSPSTLTMGFFDALNTMKPGEIMHPPFRLKGQGYWIAWVDSITPPGRPTWEGSRAAALEAYRHGAGARALTAKMAELDSMLAQGWSFDSLAALWGGPEQVHDLTAGRGLPGMGGAPLLDSLAFGGKRPPVLGTGEVSGWLSFPNGVSRVRLVERHLPTADQVAARVENARASTTEMQLQDYFSGLQRRWPVRILDPRLRDMTLVSPEQGRARP